MPVREEVQQAVAALDRVRGHLKDPEAPSADPQISAQLAQLSAFLEDPMLARMLTIQESLCQLRNQLAAHPSLLPDDFDIIPDSGELVVNISPRAKRPAAPLPPPRPPLTDGAEPVGAAEKAAAMGVEDAEAEAAEEERESDVEEGREEEEQEEEEEDGERHRGPDDSVELDDIDLEVSAQAPIMTGPYERELERAIAEVARGREVVHIELCKEDGASLGFSVAGLAIEQNQELGIFVQGIQPGGTADRDGRLQEGDQILAIDGQPLDANVSHPQAISILQKARGLVNLVVARSPEVPAETSLPSELLSGLQAEAVQQQQQQQGDMVLNTEWAQVEVIDLVNDGMGLGFGIIGGRSTGVVVKTILPGGVADRDGRLMSGDHILQIGEHNLRGMESVQVAQVLRTAGTQVRLIVARPLETSSPEFQAANSMITRAPILPTRLLADPDELDHQLQLLQNEFPEPFTRDLVAERNNMMNGMSMSEYDGMTSLGQHLGPSPPASLHLLPDTETSEVELVKDAAGLGVTIAGYVCEREELSGIFIKSVNPGSAADLSGKIAINDQIIEVDGTPLQGYSNHEAVELLKNTGQVVRLKLARYVSGPKYDQLKQAIARTEMTAPGAPAGAPEPPARPSLHGRQPSWSPEGAAVTSAHSSFNHQSPERDHWDSGNMQWIDAETSVSSGVSAVGGGVEASAHYGALPADHFRGPPPPEVEEAIQRQWTELLGDGYDIVVAQISKFQPGGGLGVSLEGTVDVEDGREVRPRHYIRSILADGPVGLNGRLRSGDELLEVNGRPLVNLNHMEVVTVLKELPTDVRLVCARAWQSAVPPDAPPPPPLDADSVLGRLAFGSGSFSGIGVGMAPEPMGFPSDRLLKAKSDSSLASSGASITDTSQSRLRSRSMEPLSRLAMWSDEPVVVILEKGDRGLGFSILDYQDPMNPNETVIVIRSLVPGGAAQLDGRLIPGDRLMSVNDVQLENASLDEAVQALKGAPVGPVRLGVAKPLPLAADTGSSQGLTTSPSDSEADEEISSASAGSQHRHLADAQRTSGRPPGCRERLLCSSTSLAASPSPPACRRRPKTAALQSGCRRRHCSGAANRQTEKTPPTCRRLGGPAKVAATATATETKEDSRSRLRELGESVESGEMLEIHLPEAPSHEPSENSPKLPVQAQAPTPRTVEAEVRIAQPKPVSRPPPPTTESTATQTPLPVKTSVPSAATAPTRATSIDSRDGSECHLLERRQQRRSSSGRSSSSSSYSSYSSTGSFSRHSSDITSSSASSARERSRTLAESGVSSVTSVVSDRNSNFGDAPVTQPALSEGGGGPGADLERDSSREMKTCDGRVGTDVQSSVRVTNTSTSDDGALCRDQAISELAVTSSSQGNAVRRSSPGPDNIEAGQPSAASEC